MAMLISPLPRGPGNGETRGFYMAMLISPLPGPYDKRDNAVMVGVRQPDETSQGNGRRSFPVA